MVMKKTLGPQPVGQPAEKERAQDRTAKVGAASESDFEIRETKRRAFLQRRGHRASERDFEPVENPGYAQRGDNHDMETAHCRRSSRAGMRVETTDADVDFAVDIAMTAQCAATPSR